ncbi:MULTISPECIES: siderophore-interacting protein [unclassified Acidovorax]|uniref:siderophore-interacting protein n=1 Tax=unclassified Acidovorax TaxID=2684926 RepID=UPI0012E0DC3D|nr:MULTISPECIES: SIP domain-containing protein [unclassified Acidovorax]
MRFTEDRVPGLLERAFDRLLLRSARVAAVQRVSDRFRLIDLEGDALKGAAWAPGHKLQVKVAGPFTARTFTPIVFDAVRGHVRLLGYAHGAGPGSDWLRRVQAGDACQVFGPHRSLALGDLAGPVVLHGDETSFGLAAAVAAAMGARAQPRCVFEVESVDEATLALQALGINAALLVERRDEAGRKQAASGLWSQGSGDGTLFVLTGRAQSIQQARQALKGHGVPASCIVAKAYWAPGKTGMD